MPQRLQQTERANTYTRAHTRTRTHFKARRDNSIRCSGQRGGPHTYIYVLACASGGFAARRPGTVSLLIKLVHSLGDARRLGRDVAIARTSDTHTHKRTPADIKFFSENANERDISLRQSWCARQTDRRRGGAAVRGNNPPQPTRHPSPASLSDSPNRCGFDALPRARTYNVCARLWRDMRYDDQDVEKNFIPFGWPLSTPTTEYFNSGAFSNTGIAVLGNTE